MEIQNVQKYSLAISSLMASEVIFVIYKRLNFLNLATYWRSSTRADIFFVTRWLVALNLAQNRITYSGVIFQPIFALALYYSHLSRVMYVVKRKTSAFDVYIHTQKGLFLFKDWLQYLLNGGLSKRRRSWK